MKKIGCLNSELSYVISKLGHFDTLTIGDYGLPVPKGVQRIDLAVTYEEFLHLMMYLKLSMQKLNSRK